MDQNMDDKVGCDEIINYIKANEISIPIEIAIEMFNDAASTRIVVSQKQL